MRRTPAVALAACLLVSAGRAHALGGAAVDAYDDVAAEAAVDAHGLLDVYGLHNFDAPASGTNQLRAADFRADRPSLGYLRLTLAHRPERVGFRVDAGVGDTASYFFRQDPAAEGHPTAARASSYFQQAFVSVVVPGDMRVDLGKFGTPVGLEDNESWSAWNYSRSLLYAWAEPSLHTGLRLSCAASDAVALSLFWVNGWNAVVFDGSTMRTGAAAVTWRVSERLVLALVDMLGPEPPPVGTGPLSMRNIVDAFATYAASERLSFAVTGDYGADGAHGGVDWYGVGAYARWQATPGLAVSARAEVLDDPQGFVTGLRQRVAEGTATVELGGAAWRARWAARLEYRNDGSTARPFDGAVPASLAHQQTLTLALLADFQ